MRSTRVQVAVALLFFVLAMVHAFATPMRERTDTVFLGLLALGLAVLAIPWNRISGFSLGGVSVTLDAPQVAGAISATVVDRVQNERLRGRLEALGDVVQTINGARVIWVDDYPENIIGERRILRALGVDVVPASSTRRAVELLGEDGDFDLMITDVQRRDEGDQGSYPAAGTNPLHEGANFVELLRRGRVPGLPDIPAIRRIPVVFYAAYPWESLRRWTAGARDIEPGAVAANDVTALLENVVVLLARARRQPIETPARKVPS